MATVVLTQGPLTAAFRGERDQAEQWRKGFADVLKGLETGARLRLESQHKATRFSN